MGRVIIGMDPHKRSATIEIINGREKVLAQGRFGTDRDGYAAMLKRAGSTRIGSGRWRAATASAGTSPNGWSLTARPCSTCRRSCPRGLGCSTPPRPARPTPPTRTASRWPRCAPPGCGQVVVDDVTVALKLLVDRRDGLGRARTEALSRLHHLLLELVPGGAKQFLSAPQARALLNTVRPRDIVGRTRRQLASELITEVAVIDKKIKAANTQLTELVDVDRQHAAAAARDRTVRRRPAAGRHRRRQPLRQPRPLRVLERHRTHRRVLRRPATPPAVPGREPAHQPGPAHHGHRPASATTPKAAPTTAANSPPAWAASRAPSGLVARRRPGSPWLCNERRRRASLCFAQGRQDPPSWLGTNRKVRVPRHSRPIVNWW